jgi:hypothetical protein
MSTWSTFLLSTKFPKSELLICPSNSHPSGGFQISESARPPRLPVPSLSRGASSRGVRLRLATRPPRLARMAGVVAGRD